MESLLRPIYQEHAGDIKTLGVLIMEKTLHNSTVTDDFDVILLILVSESEQSWQVKHYEFEGKTAALHIVTKDLLMEWIDTSGYRKAVEWVIYGKKVFDRNEFVGNLKEQLRDFPVGKRDLRKVIEFGKLIKSYREAKELFESNEYKDANSKILYSLHYLARLAVIEKGYYPEVMVWNQVKQIDIEVYKLYEEFIESNEEIEKRIQLMIIAMDFVISNRAKNAVMHLLNMMQAKNTAWSYEELKELSMTASFSLDLSAIISYLVEKNIIDTVKEQTKGAGVFQRKYVVNNAVTHNE